MHVRTRYDLDKLTPLVEEKSALALIDFGAVTIAHFWKKLNTGLSKGADGAITDRNSRRRRASPP